MFLRYLMLMFVAAVLVASEPISSEPVRVEILNAMFPGTVIAVVPGRSIDDASRGNDGFRDYHHADAMRNERVYTVSGAAVGETERCAAEDLVEGTFSKTRELRFQVFRWPGGRGASSEVVAIAQYRFAGASPAFGCLSIGRLFHVRHEAGRWAVRGDLVLETTHHSRLMAVRLADLSGDGLEELIVESDRGGGGYFGIGLDVFDLSHGGFDRWIGVPVYASLGMEERFTQTLDFARTLSLRAAQFCFTKTSYAEGGRVLAPPKVTTPCYPRGLGQ